MRFKFRKLLQAAVLLIGLIVYINFFFLAKGFVAVDQESVTVKDKQRQVDVDDVHNKHLVLAKSHIATTFEPKAPVVSNETRNPLRARLAFPVTDSLSTDVFPNYDHYDDDRILLQLNHIPKTVKKFEDEGKRVPLKTILIHSGLGGWAVKRGQSTFLEQKCAVPHCSITSDRAQLSKADVVMFNNMAREKQLPHQKFLIFMLESPYHTPTFRLDQNVKFNWTATYRHDSTIVAPYEKFVPFNASIVTKEQNRNFAEGKTKKVAWFVSNCGARNNRKQYAEELKKHIQVDIYGRCGTMQCPRHQSSKCFGLLNKDYKFYLAFENSNCRDYITEKFYVNGLKHDVIPIVMGAAPEDYARAAPPHSYIHVDDFESPKALAEYLHKLDTNDDLYNEYFRWKGTGDIINTFYWCRVCALAHETDGQPSWIEDINSWWRGKDVCIGSKSWREVKDRPRLIADLAVHGHS